MHRAGHSYYGYFFSTSILKKSIQSREVPRGMGTFTKKKIRSSLVIAPDTQFCYLPYKACMVRERARMRGD